MPMICSFLIRLWVVAVTAGVSVCVAAADSNVLQPRITGDWWQVAGNPDLGTLTATKQQPVDFGIWQAADDTWQIWSCIRGTKEPGKTRLFYGWQGSHLTDTNWTPMGIAMQANTNYAEVRGGLQAPSVIFSGGRYWMFYGDWNDICCATSTDGKEFTRVLNALGKSALFSEGAGSNTRDPEVINIGGVWHCYYNAYPHGIGADYCRTSLDLTNWSASTLVACGGQSGSTMGSAECPFVVQLEPRQFYLFRTQHYGRRAQTSVYFSDNPLDFGVNHDEGHFICTLPVAAPEIVQHDGKWFMAVLLPDLKGIQISHLTWDKTDKPL